MTSRLQSILRLGILLPSPLAALSAPILVFGTLSLLAFACGASPPSESTAATDTAETSSVESTLTVDGTAVTLSHLSFRDEGDYVSVTVTDQPVPTDLEIGSYAAEGITGVELAFVKEPLALDEYLPVMATHPTVDVLMLEGVDLTGSHDAGQVFQIDAGLAETEIAGSRVSFELHAAVDLGTFEPCQARTATIDRADSESTTVLASFFRALHECDFKAARGHLTESASAEWDALSEGRRHALTTRAPLHLRIVEIQAGGEGVENVVVEAVPADGMTTGILVKQEGGNWKIAEGELSF